MTLLGPSGCGKTTTLNIIAGLEEVTSGEVRIGGRAVNDLGPFERDVAMVFQNYALYPHMTVAENIGFTLRLRKRPREEIRARVGQVAATLELEHLLERLPRELSGGQQQRVALGRALIREPAVFLFDEPFSNLDAALRVRMRSEIKELHQRLRVTSVFVTHDQEEAMSISDRVAIMRAGRVEQVGTPEEVYARPVSTYVARFVGSPQMELLSGELLRTDGSARYHVGEVSFPVPPGVAAHPHRCPGGHGHQARAHHAGRRGCARHRPGGAATRPHDLRLGELGRRAPDRPTAGHGPSVTRRAGVDRARPRSSPVLRPRQRPTQRDRTELLTGGPFDVSFPNEGDRARAQSRSAGGSSCTGVAPAIASQVEHLPILHRVAPVDAGWRAAHAAGPFSGRRGG